MKHHKVRTYKSAERLDRADQLAWKIATVAADPVRVEDDVAEMIGNRIIDNAAVAAASIARHPVATARAQAQAHPQAHARDGLRPAERPALSAGMGGLGQRRRRPRTRFPRHVSRRRLFAPRRQHPAGAGGGAALRRLGRGAAARTGRGLRNPGRSGEGHLPARTQDRSHRPSRPVGGRRHRRIARPADRDDLPGGAAGASRHHHHAAIAQGRDFELEGLCAGLCRQDGDRSRRPRDARRRRAVAGL